MLIGGVGGAILGPQVMINTQDLWPPYLFIVSYFFQTVLAIAAFVVLQFLDIPKPAAALPGAARARPFLTIVSQPRFIAAVACGVASYSIMNMVMTSAPLAMIMCGHSAHDASVGIQWHVLGMFVPSLFTDSLIARFGVERVIAAVLALLGASAVVSLSGLTLGHFFIGLAVLGMGWNFSFIGATAMVTQCYQPAERTTIQSFNDFMIFGTMAVGSFLSGTLLATYGWNWVNNVVFPVVGLAGVLLAWEMVRRRTAAARA